MMYNMNKENEEKKRESHPVLIGVVLFFSALVFALGCKYTKRNNETDQHWDKMWDRERVDKEEMNTEEKTVVVIDPGHGGNDPGKVSSSGVLEKDINLQIALCLKEELINRGMSPIVLREIDTNLATEGATNKKVSDMKNRVAIINESSAVIFVSIHQNSYTDPSVRGPQVFYNSNSEDSEAFAELLQDKLNDINPENTRKIKGSEDYYILNKSSCPGVIIECGFLSCPEETALLTDAIYQQKIASAVADAIQETY